MLLYYLWKLKIQIFCRKRKQIAFLIAFSFVIHSQILIFSVFKIANLCACRSPAALRVAQCADI